MSNGTSYTWGIAQSGTWNVASNWTPGTGYPDNNTYGNDSALISAVGTAYSVAYNLASGIVAELAVTSGNATLALGSNDQLLVYGTVDLTAGTIDINAGAALLADGNAYIGGLVTANGGSLVAGAIDLTTGGTIDAINNGWVHVNSGVTIASGAVFEIDSGSTIVNGSMLSVSGILQTTTGIATAGWTNLVGNGTIEANGGTLILTGNVYTASPIHFEIANSQSSDLTFTAAQTGDTIHFAGPRGELSFGSGSSSPQVTVVGLNAGNSSTVPTNFIDFLSTAVTVSSGGTGSGATGTVHLSDGVVTLSGITNLGGSGWAVNTISDGNSGTDVFLTSVCYAAGTRILTTSGEKPVETLTDADIVLTLSGNERVPQPVKWVGHRRIDIAAHPRPETVSPIRIGRGAFADAVPHTDLLVSPDHGILVDGKLICARQLVNFTTIRQENDRATADYFHIELESHAILLAEGLPAESYLDTGNRGFFANAAGLTKLHPDLTDQTDYPARESASCHPFVWDEETVRPVWQRLADRAAILGQPVPAPDTTTDPALFAVANGRTLRPIHAENGLHIFALPKGARTVRLTSRAGSPTESRPWLEDRRCLGVYVERIVLRDADGIREIPLDHPGLSQGWWAVERDGSALRRWTNGDAILPMADGADLLEVRIGFDAMAYVTRGQPRLAA